MMARRFTDQDFARYRSRRPVGTQFMAEGGGCHARNDAVAWVKLETPLRQVIIAASKALGRPASWMNIFSCWGSSPTVTYGPLDP
jgi:hypothetical protein